MKFTFLQVREVIKEMKMVTNQLILVRNKGEYIFEDFSLVNCLSHRMNKKNLTLLLK